MKLQLLSDLHLETEAFVPTPAPGAELLVVAGDIDSRWDGLAAFAGWPVPVVFVAGNHEFDRRDFDAARIGLRERCTALGLDLLDCTSRVRTDARGRRIRFLGTTRWSDFDVFGPDGVAAARRAGRYFAKVMRTTRYGEPFDADRVREEALRCRDWLAAELRRPSGDWERTVVVTHFAPSLRSADPRYGHQPGTASFCNADDDLLPLADLWLHGHLHCRSDYRVDAPPGGGTRVVCNPRGHAGKGEPDGFEPHCVIEV